MSNETGTGSGARYPSRAFTSLLWLVAAFTSLLWLVAAAVLTRAILAGRFISSTAPARLMHLVIGAVLPWFAIAPAVVALRGRRRLTTGVVTGTMLLPVALWAGGTGTHALRRVHRHSCPVRCGIVRGVGGACPLLEARPIG